MIHINKTTDNHQKFNQKTKSEFCDKNHFKD